MRVTYVYIICMDKSQLITSIVFYYTCLQLQMHVDILMRICMASGHADRHTNACIMAGYYTYIHTYMQCHTILYIIRTYIVTEQRQHVHNSTITS